ncbi:MAG: site-specific integrase [Gammaproteobacteria bacterium]|nr:site-specific integrase [Gammaproteobacteria bacterium]
MAAITQTKSGTWKAIIRRKDWPTAIKTFRLKKDAENWARIAEDEILRGIHIPKSVSENIPLSDALDRYLKEITPTKKPTTQQGNIVQAKQLNSKLGRFHLSSLNTAQIAAFRDQRLKEGKSNDTVRFELVLLSHLYNIAIREWGVGLAVNHVLNVKKPSAGKGRNRRLEGKEEDRLIAACKEHSNALLAWIVELAIYTAMRKSEILNLTRRNINMTKRTVTLFDTKNDYVRTVPMPNKAHKSFEYVLDYPLRPNDTELLFFGEPGRDSIRRPYTISTMWLNALKKADIQALKFHDLRHEATSRLVETGLSDQEVSSISGHNSMQMLRRYTHLRGGDLVSKIKDI